VGTKTAILLLLIGFLYRRIDMFVDLALVYSILNFISTLIVSRYFIKKGVHVHP
jgi:multicomponent Na+:H+ antiporter subunit F